jgi:hypothetical protein
LRAQVAQIQADFAGDSSAEPDVGHSHLKGSFVQKFRHRFTIVS